ncbi:MAG: glycoside hydrolase family 97 protein [Bryobacteraceae bacterium]
MRNGIGVSLLIGFLALSATAAAQPASAALKSPDGRLAITFETVQKKQPAPSGQLVYSVTYKGKPLMERSDLSLTLQGWPALGTNVRIVDRKPSTFDQTYRLVTGKASEVRNHYNALRLDLEGTGRMHLKLAIEARAYNDAVAFRYVVPTQNSLHEFRLVQEHTHFRLAKDATVWALMLPHFRTQYESDYTKINASAFATSNGLSKAVLIGLPLLMHVPGVAWMAITEANLRGYSSMYLKNPGGGWSNHEFVSVLAPGDDPDVVVTGSLPHHSGWRVLLVGDKPGTLVASNVITSLNPPSAIKDTSWIHAGLTSWNWWSGSIGPDGKRAFTTATMKYYVDFAAKSGFPYMLIDAGWSKPGDITQMNGRVNVPEVVRYAAKKNVKVWIWLTTREVQAQMEEAFPLYHKWGVAGLKIDFVEHDNQDGIEFYYRAAEEAARDHLMLDFHGATKPTGLERTYPNVLSYEGVMGMEWNKGGMRDTPAHRVTLAFTRMLAGPMDYTPGGFDNVTRANFVARNIRPMVMGTRAQQLALYVIFEAPFQMVSDAPQAYANQPAFNFIKHCPATWDETKVLNGLPGRYITMARRKGKDWYLGSITDWTPRTLDVPLTFLGSGKYTAEIYADAADADVHPKNVSITKQVVDSSRHLNIRLAPGGGYAVRFIPAP